MPVERICQTCGKTFQVVPSRMKAGKNPPRFCSWACFVPDLKGTAFRVERVCETCGATFYVVPLRLEAEGQPARFCSIACAAKSRVGWSPRPGLSEHRDAIAEAYRSGTPMTVLAKDYGVTAQAIGYQLDLAGVPRRQAGKHTPEGRQRTKAAAPRGERSPRWRSLPVDELRAAYEAGESTVALANRYGVTRITIDKRLRLAGATIRDPGFSRYRTMRDGCRVQSHYERAVHGWLVRHGLAHTCHPPAPWDSGERGPRADFLVGDAYIEVWGVENNPDYERRRLAKVAAYAACGARLIELWPESIVAGDFSALAPLVS